MNGLLELARRSWPWLLARGVLLVIFGVVVMVWPQLTLNTFVMLIGIATIIDGASGVLTALMAHGSDQTRRWLVGLVGAVTLIVGLVVLTRPDATISVVTMLVAFWALIVGVERIAHAVTYRRRSSAWTWLLLAGLATIVLGLVLLFWPGMVLVVASVILGVASLLAGVVTTVAAVMLRSAVRNHPERLVVEGVVEPTGLDSDHA